MTSTRVLASITNDMVVPEEPWKGNDSHKIVLTIVSCPHD